ncbi:MAG: hypothetical protein ACE14T_01605 [Syntrophales bacterium]
MVWMVERIKTRFVIEETGYDLDVPIQIEIEYRVEGNRVHPSSLSKKLYYNRPLLIKESRDHTAGELDQMVERAAERAVKRHFQIREYTVEQD